uniref:Uncharacterized protein n=1 Tax=Timema bartmani TaxID=61472 RepID=A0A7R9FCX0_9NEOP|nr:unnamed protein product [Timema bartmani]
MGPASERSFCGSFSNSQLEHFPEDVGSGIDPTLATVLMGSVRCLMSGCNTGLMKRFGRRPLCMLSGCGMTICLSVSGYFTWKILKDNIGGVAPPITWRSRYSPASLTPWGGPKYT